MSTLNLVSSNDSAIRFVLASGITGPPGNGAIVSFVSSNADTVTLPSGTPVAAQTPGVVRAKASDATRPAIGVLNASAAAASSAVVQINGTVTKADWTEVLGTALLSPRQLYFADPVTPGKLTTTVPTTIGHIVQVIGVGLTTDTMELQIGQPLWL